MPGTPILAGAGGGGDPTGACCDDATGDCTVAVAQTDCETAGSRYGGDGSDCATIDPACTAPLPGACCGPGDCVEVMQTECDAAGRLFRGDGTLCENQANCANIPTVSEWGLIAMSLGVLAAGTWVVRKRQTELDPNRPTAG